VDNQMTYQEWVEANPLRVWRSEHGKGYPQAAALIGVSVNTIKYWETGANRPSPENMLYIEQATGGEVTAAAWAEWLKALPGRERIGSNGPDGSAEAPADAADTPAR
jgi:DNA-binding transcriptional regulator YdaS (Cro superfamily)